jgi:hypothetical protein
MMDGSEQRTTLMWSEEKQLFACKKLYRVRPDGPAHQIFLFFVRVPTATGSWIPDGGGEEGSGRAAVTQSHKKVVIVIWSGGKWW